MDKNYIVHWGIKGMKWGRRRWQNEDGSLTAEGKEHYRKVDNAFSEGKDGKPSRAQKIGSNAKDLTREAKNLGSIISGMSDRKKPKTDLSGISDDELRRRINRLNMEKQYRDLSSDGSVSKGRRAFNDTMDIIGSVAAIATATAGIVTAAYAIKNRKSNP